MCALPMQVVGTLFVKALTGLGKSDSAGSVFVHLSVGVSGVLVVLIACSWYWLARAIPSPSGLLHRKAHPHTRTHAIRLEDLNLTRSNDDDSIGAAKVVAMETDSDS